MCAHVWMMNDQRLRSGEQETGGLEQPRDGIDVSGGTEAEEVRWRRRGGGNKWSAGSVDRGFGEEWKNVERTAGSSEHQFPIGQGTEERPGGLPRCRS